MLSQARLRLSSGRIVDAIHALSLEEAGFGGPEDFNGNRSFAFGGAILAPFANRIQGLAVPDTREIETKVAGHTVRLPRNWGGKAPGARQYAMHGLILDAAVPVEQPSSDHVLGRLDAGDFGGRWPGRLGFVFDWRLQAGDLVLSVRAENTGEEPTVVGFGWHPYFALPSGDRRQARLRLPGALRVEVNDYDEVLPTGRLAPVAGTPYDFNEGRALDELYLDDCFTGLAERVCEIEDPAADLRLRIASSSDAVSAFQVYAPPDKAFVVVEPQFNLADPFGAEWGAGVHTGMVTLRPGEKISYDVRLSACALGTP